MSGRNAIIDQSTTVLKKVSEYIDAGIESTIEVAAEVVEQEKDETNRTRQVEEMKEVMMRYIKMDEELKNFIKATEHAKQFLKDGGDLQQMENELDRHLIVVKKESEAANAINTHPKLAEMNEKIHAALNPEEEEEDEEPQTETIDEDLAVTQDTLNTKCPYTGMEMTNPVRNKHCGHVYDKQGVQDLCKKRSKPKCPIPGCVNQKPISMDDMEEDKALKKKIQALNKKQSKGRRK